MADFHFDYANFSVNYCRSGALEYGLFVTLVIATICFILTKLTHEYSWVDRMWSLLPGLYALHFLYHQSQCRSVPVSDRQWIMLCIAWVWGLRLTYNFYRKGGYAKGGEDYRWAYLRERYHWILMELLNFFFTAYGQLVLIYLFSAPIYLASAAKLTWVDFALANLTMGFITLESLTDNQQWRFQQEKHRLLKEGKPLPFPFSVGFNTTGLFRFSRHPNFFAEMCIWWVYYFFTIQQHGWNWSFIGTLLLTFLFQGSTNLTEQISCEKYPQYKEYQRTTSRLLPLPAGPPISPTSKKST
jgi:steroid 5-alpha reductase family enzyme